MNTVILRTLFIKEQKILFSNPEDAYAFYTTLITDGWDADISDDVKQWKEAN